jgi:hypothetical protein
VRVSTILSTLSGSSRGQFPKLWKKFGQSKAQWPVVFQRNRVIADVLPQKTRKTQSADRAAWFRFAKYEYTELGASADILFHLSVEFTELCLR